MQSFARLSIVVSFLVGVSGACSSKQPPALPQSESTRTGDTQTAAGGTTAGAGTAAEQTPTSPQAAGSGGAKTSTGGGGSTTLPVGGMSATTAPGSGTSGTSGTTAGAMAMAGSSAGAGGGGGETAPTETCDKTVPPSMDCSAKLAPGDERRCMIGSRKYIVHAGKNMNLCKPAALVIDAHGATETAEQQLGNGEFCTGATCWRGGSGWAAESDAPSGGFIAVFPQGNNNMWTAADADFMLNIVTELKKVADIDPEKVYISGISNGGFLTFQTGCPHSDVFKGMAPNSGGSSCSSVKQPIPLISFDAAPDFAYSGHKSANMSVITANKCKGASKPWLTVDSKYTEPVCRSNNKDSKITLVPCNQVTAAMIKPTVCNIWEECDGGAKVVWCEVAPASNDSTAAHIIYENATNLNTPSLAWRFFKSFWH